MQTGGGNWEFEYYLNNRTNSFVRNQSLYIWPTLLEDTIGEANVLDGFTLDISGGDPADLCTSNAEYGCLRASAGGNILNPIQSAAIRTAETFAFTYGRVEVVAQLPKGDWMWPAIWMMPVNSQYGGWPTSGEIDIMESRGNARGYPAGGCESFSSTLHWGPYAAVDGWEQTHGTYTMPTGDLSQGFHTYGLLWNETTMMTYLDDPTNVVLSVDIGTQSFWQRGGWNATGMSNPWVGEGNNAPFDQRFYLIINLAVGGTNGYFPDGVGGKPWTDASGNAFADFNSAQSQWYPSWPQQGGGGSGSPFIIDSVRVWQQVAGGDFAYRPML